jgi:hypothetical protein
MRWRRLLLRIGLAAGALLTVLVAVALWGIFWPPPAHAPSIKCPARSPFPHCIQISGRVLFHTRKLDIDRLEHIVLLSRSSVTLPGITSVEIPPLPRPPGGLGFGDWVSFIGFETTGAHGEHDIHAAGLETVDTMARCARFSRVAGSCQERGRR